MHGMLTKLFSLVHANDCIVFRRDTFNKTEYLCAVRNFNTRSRCVKIFLKILDKYCSKNILIFRARNSVLCLITTNYLIYM